MLEKLKSEVYEANLLLTKYGLFRFSWGNVPAIDRESGHVVIEPSGIAYHEMSPLAMVVLTLDGKIVEGNLKPSSDTGTHIELYPNFKGIGCIVQSHSRWAQFFHRPVRK